MLNIVLCDPIKNSWLVEVSDIKQWISKGWCKVFSSFICGCEEWTKTRITDDNEKYCQVNMPILIYF